jgi:hypothetical protein
MISVASQPVILMLPYSYFEILTHCDNDPNGTLKGDGSEGLGVIELRDVSPKERPRLDKEEDPLQRQWP